MAEKMGIPYATSNPDGSKTCPICGQKCFGMDPKYTTDEDQVTKGSGQVYALHYQEKHSK